MALALAEAGADVALIGRTEPTETLKRIAKIGVKGVSISADLSHIETVDEIIDEAVSKLGRVDILVNNSGIIKRNDAIDFTSEDWDAVMNVNLKTVFFCLKPSQAFARHLVSEEKGWKIINIASMHSFQGGIRVPSYTASKSGGWGINQSSCQRVGRAKYKCQRHCTWVFRDQQYGGIASRYKTQC